MRKFIVSVRGRCASFADSTHRCSESVDPDFVITERNDSTAAEDDHCERLHSGLVYNPAGSYLTPYDINGISTAVDNVSEALDRHAFEDEVGVRSSPSLFSCKLIRSFQV